MKTSKPTPSAAKIRQMTICKKGVTRVSNKYVFFPLITLSGKWMNDVGFDIGQVIDIAYEEGRIVITPSAVKREWVRQRYKEEVVEQEN